MPAFPAGHTGTAKSSRSGRSDSLLKVALDAMGGDEGPRPIVEGAVRAARDFDVEIILVGDQAAVKGELDRHQTAGLKLSLLHAPQTVDMHEAPSHVVRRKRDSSIWIATELVRRQEAAAVISAGNTGACMATALFVLGTLPGVERPAIAALLPMLSGTSLLLDVGANVDCKPHHLFQFAVMGHVFTQRILGVPNPRVGLLSIGEEDTKGNELTKEAFKILKGSPLNFIGNVEGRDVYAGTADVIVCDGFIGNVALKISEGLAELVMRLLEKEIGSSRWSRLSYALAKPAFTRFHRRIDYAEYGGALLLGLNGISIICHGRSSAKAIRNAVRIAIDFSERRVNDHIRDDIESNRALYFGGKGDAPP